MKKNNFESFAPVSFIAAGMSNGLWRGSPASVLRRLLIGVFAVSSPAFALSSADRTFHMQFDSLAELTGKGTCTIGGAPCVESSVLVTHGGGMAARFNKTGFPKVSFPVVSGSHVNITPEKGTIIFDYKPGFASPNDWSASGTKAQKIFFRLYDSSSTIASLETLGIGTFFDSGKHYIYFRYDTTDACTFRWDGAAPCYHGVSSINTEPGVIMEWDSTSTHRIVATWDFTSTATKRLIALSIDGGASWYTELTTPTDVSSFNPSEFFVGSNNGSNSAQGLIDNLEIYDEVAFDPADPVGSYISSLHNDGVWQSHETAADTTDAPVLDISDPFIFFESYPFQPIFEGDLPEMDTDPADIVVHVVKNQRETAFFNIYAGDTGLGVVTTSVSNLVSGANTIDKSTIKVRTVKNWWQAGNDIQRNLFVPVYTPELLVYNDLVNLQCTGSGTTPCAGGAYPSDPATAYTVTQVAANTSRQFALTFDIPESLAAGTYSGTITASSATVGARTQSLKVIVHDIVLPEIDRTIALYHANQFADNTRENYVTPSLFQKQMRNMRSHGVNGMLFGGQAWSVAQAKQYPSLAVTEGMTKLGAYPLNASGYPLSSTDVEKTGYMIEGLNFHGFAPFMYGEDEPTEANGKMPKHLQKTQAIHQCLAPPLAGVCGKVVVAITKEFADKINDASVSSYLGYGVEERKLDLPNLAVESFDAKTVDYFGTLLSGDHSEKPSYNELYYWQMYREDPRINRFYTGYHLWLSGLEGVMPYVYQRIAGNPFNDFDGGLVSERDLNTVYPSLEGGIDTIQWEAFRAGVDDYRFLQLWGTLHAKLALCSPNDAEEFAEDLEDIVSKYRNRRAFKNESQVAFALDRQALIDLIDAMQSRIAVGSGNKCKHGLTASYFNDSDTNSSGAITALDDKLVAPAVLQRIDSNVDMNLASLVSPGSGVNADYFSARWSGRVVVPNYTGTYTFCLKGDDGYRLWIDGTDLFGSDHWVAQDSVHDCATIDLTAGQVVPIEVEFFDLTEEAILQLTWSWPGQAEVVVPNTALYAE